MIRVLLPAQLAALAKVERYVEIEAVGVPSVESVLDALEARYPMLRGTLRDQVSKERRPFIRFFALGEDLSLDPASDPLPEAVANGEAPLRVVGSMAGG